MYAVLDPVSYSIQRARRPLKSEFVIKIRDTRAGRVAGNCDLIRRTADGGGGEGGEREREGGRGENLKEPWDSGWGRLRDN